MNEPLDPDVVYKAGSGKKHGRDFIGNGYINSRVSSSQSRSMCTPSDDDIRPSRQVCTRVDIIGELETQIAEMRQILLVSFFTMS